MSRVFFPGLASFIAPTNLAGLRERCRRLFAAAARALTAGGMSALCALAIGCPPTFSNDGFTSIYTTFYLTDILAAHGLPTTPPNPWLAIAGPIFWLVMIAMLLVIAFLHITGRRMRSAICLVALVLSVRVYQAWQYRIGFETVPAKPATYSVLNTLDPREPGLTAAQRSAIVFIEAQAGYLRGDAKTTARWLNAMPIGLDFPIFAAEWRLAIMQDWARAHGEAIAEPQLGATNASVRPFKRIAALILWITAALGLTSSIAATALGVGIHRRAHRLAILVASPAASDLAAARSARVAGHLSLR